MALRSGGGGQARTISLNFSPNRARNFVSRSESFEEVLAFLETAKSFLAASAAVSLVRQTAIVCERWHKYKGYGKAKGRLDLSEAPQAYKDIESVIDAERDLIEPLVRLVPMASLKG